jgi:hypothetical protein
VPHLAVGGGDDVLFEFDCSVSICFYQQVECRTVEHQLHRQVKRRRLLWIVLHRITVLLHDPLYTTSWSDKNVTSLLVDNGHKDKLLADTAQSQALKTPEDDMTARHIVVRKLLLAPSSRTVLARTIRNTASCQLQAASDQTH